MTVLDGIRQRLGARFGFGYPVVIAVPEAWLPYLDELDRELAKVSPGYELLQVKTQFNMLRFYIEHNYMPSCCENFDELSNDYLEHAATSECIKAWEQLEEVDLQLTAIITCYEAASATW